MQVGPDDPEKTDLPRLRPCSDTGIDYQEHRMTSSDLRSGPS